MAVFVIIGVKGGTGIKKLIKKYAVMFNSLLSVICFLPGVDSHYYDYSDIDAVQFYDVDQRPSTTKTIERRFRRDDSAIEDVGIIIGAFVGIITLILAFGIIYMYIYIYMYTICCRHCDEQGNLRPGHFFLMQGNLRPRGSPSRETIRSSSIVC